MIELRLTAVLRGGLSDERCGRGAAVWTGDSSPAQRHVRLTSAGLLLLLLAGSACSDLCAAQGRWLG